MIPDRVLRGLATRVRSNWAPARPTLNQTGRMDSKFTFTVNGQSRTVSTDPQQPLLDVLRVCQVFECGAILNPDNLPMNLVVPEGCRQFPLSPSEGERAGVRAPTRDSGAQSASKGRGILSQVQGAIVMGLGPALREEMRFENGEMLNAAFRKYHIPRFQDVPELDIYLLNHPDLSSAGAGETPIMVIAPAIANAVFHATGVRVRTMPIEVPKL